MDYNNFCFLGDQFEYNLGHVQINSKFFKKQKQYENLIQHIVEIITDSLKISLNCFNQDKFVVSVDLKYLELGQVDKDLLFKLVNVLETLFPEKLSTCYISGASSFFKGIYKCLSLFINKRTRSKIKFVKKNGKISTDEEYLNCINSNENKNTLNKN